MEMNLPTGIARHEVDESIKRVANIFRVDRDLRRGVLHLHGAQCIRGGHGIVLGDLNIKFFPRLEIEPSQAAGIELIRVSAKRSDSLCGGVAAWPAGKAWSLIKWLAGRHG